MDRISLGIIGAGKIVKTMHLPILYNIPSVRVDYIADLEDKSSIAHVFKAQPIQLDKSTRTEFPETDAVFLATPLGVRQQYMLDPVVRQSCILTEKPFIDTLENHKALINQHKNVMCNYNRKYYAIITTLKKVIDSSLLGELREVAISESAMKRGTGKGSTHYQFNKDMSGGGLLMERGCHTLSQLDILFPDTEIAVVDTTVEAISGFDIDVRLELNAIFNASTSLPISYHLSAGRLFETLSNYTFDNGTISFDHTDASSPMVISDTKGNQYTIQPDAHFAVSGLQSFYLSWISFIDRIKTSQMFSPGIDTSIRTTEIIDIVYRRAGLI
jgi:predicted dehydrogenase